MVGSMNWKHKSTLNLSILTFIRRKLVLLAETRQQQLPKQILLKSINYEVNMNTEHMQMLHGVMDHRFSSRPNITTDAN